MRQLQFIELVDESMSNPSVRVWPGDPTNPMPTLREAFTEGRRSGLYWPKENPNWHHMPGGPFVHGGRGHNDPLAAQARHSQAVHREWLRGWHSGFQEQCGGEMPHWYREHRV